MNSPSIACRIIRTARSLGIRTIAIFSQADRTAPHVLQADEAVLVGGNPVGESYLAGDKIIEIAKQTGAQAIHPGYGFLSENHAFAKSVTDQGIVFVGPPSDAVAIMGNKAEAKRHMLSAGVPCVPGYQEKDQNPEKMKQAALEIGFPLMVKAAAGGGGRGMRLVEDIEALSSAMAAASAEAASAFGSGELILEKAIMNARHVEIQIFADRFGNCIHLGERDCSVQRRNQKVIEEAPCPAITEALRAQMGEAAVAAAKAVQYEGAGTVEFLLGDDKQFYFLEMNTRLQVEHAVTEMITGLDLVALQFAVAQGEPLSLDQAQVALNGHAIEVRLYAEDPANGFLPTTGQIERWKPSHGPGIRWDAGIASGQEISPFYDPLLAKLIVHAPDRETARKRLVHALKHTVFFGPPTNIEFLIDALEKTDFTAGNATTSFIDAHYRDGFAAPFPDPMSFAIAAALVAKYEQNHAFATSTMTSTELLGWSNSPLSGLPITLSNGGKSLVLQVTVKPTGCAVAVDPSDSEMPPERWHLEPLEIDETSATIVMEGAVRNVNYHIDAAHRCWIATEHGSYCFETSAGVENFFESQSANIIVAPMPGVVVTILVAPGQTVVRGESLAVLEAMKMQHPVLGTSRRCDKSGGD